MFIQAIISSWTQELIQMCIIILFSKAASYLFAIIVRIDTLIQFLQIRLFCSPTAVISCNKKSYPISTFMYVISISSLIQNTCLKLVYLNHSKLFVFRPFYCRIAVKPKVVSENQFHIRVQLTNISHKSYKSRKKKSKIF